MIAVTAKVKVDLSGIARLRLRAKPFRLTVGYGGPGRHPSSSKATVAEIASYHNEGAGNLPVRRIIVAPPPEVIERMGNDLKQAVEKGDVDDAVAIVAAKWGVRYRSFIQERFDTYSKGGGDWPPLKASTVKARRSGKKSKKKKPKATILRDTSTLFTALQPQFAGAPGAIEQITRGY